MTKIGEGKELPKQPSIQEYRNSIDNNSVKFLNALESYTLAGDGEQKAQLKAIMDQQLALINSAVKEIKQAGIYKQDVKVENDYKQFISTGNPDAKNALEEDLETLRNYAREM